MPSTESEPEGVAPGADGNVWFVEAKSGKIGRIGTGAPEAAAAAPTLAGNLMAGSPQQCNATWATWASLQPSSSLFGFDGYSWSLGGAQVATGQSLTPIAADIGDQLTCSETVSYPLIDVTASATSAPATVLAPPPPAISQLRESAATWREGGRLAAISGAAGARAGRSGSKKARRPPLGTTFSFVLSEQASVSLSFSRAPEAHRPAAVCAGSATGRLRKHRRASCPRGMGTGALSFAGAQGANRVLFQGRLSRTRSLEPGRYTLAITATNAEGRRSSTASLHFTIRSGT